MQQVPDLTTSGTGVLPCTSVSFTRRKGTIYRDWTLKFVVDIGPKGDLPLLPTLVRFARQPILQARRGGIALKGWKLEPGWEGKWTITFDLDGNDEEPMEACLKASGTLSAIIIDASENVTKLTYVLTIKASPESAPGLVWLEGQRATVAVSLEPVRAPDLFTRPGDVPEQEDLLAQDAGSLPDEPDEPPATARPKRRRPAAKAKPAEMAEA